MKNMVPPKVTRLSSVARTPGAARLRELREAAGLTQEQAAQVRGVDARQVRRWENGESPLDAVEYLLELEALAARRAA
jgi:transcriptional regulator with XRE-family HTH domain